MTEFLTAAVASLLLLAHGEASAGTEDVEPRRFAASGMDDVEEVRLAVGQSSLISIGERVQQVVVIDGDIADAQPMDADEVLLIGKLAGSTDVVLRLESGDTICRRVVVDFDSEGLESSLARLFGIRVDVEQVGDTLAVRGMLPDVRTAEMLTEFMTRLGHDWVDMTRIPGVRQVQLRVRIAEASRTALRELAFGGVAGGSSFFGGVQAPGGLPFQSTGIAPADGAAVGDADFRFQNMGVSSATTLFAGVPGANLEVFLQALDQNQYVRVLAEPNLVAASGEEATFLVGGEFPIPVVQGSDAGGGATVTIEYKEFGVQLVFRPEVLGDGRIRLDVAPEVSELSEIGAVTIQGFKVPGVTTRRSSTTVELGGGQSFAMAGLLRSVEQGRTARVPLLGDLPILGTLFRSVRYNKKETELLVIVTADLVEPLDDGFDRPVPGDLHQTPDDWDLFVEGRLDGEIPHLSPLARLEALGLDGLVGPGAWRRPDDTREAAGDPLPTGPVKQGDD
ncbi:MAG: hypothetical protein CMJ34_07520 [Phycisphaerae bacterium]|nr:hypothetical protein [Phycisphaerae bacterium]